MMGRGITYSKKEARKLATNTTNGTAEAGGLEFGEKVADCLKKEVKEEYCADIISSEFLGYYEAHRTVSGKSFGSAQDKPTHWIALHFKVLVDPKQVKNGEPHKFDEIKWFKLDNLPPTSELHSQLPAEIEKYKSRL